MASDNLLRGDGCAEEDADFECAINGDREINLTRWTSDADMGTTERKGMQ